LLTTKLSWKNYLSEAATAAGLENRGYGRRGSAALTMRHPAILKSWHYLSREAAAAWSV
jgi:hypothetical protein